MRCLRSRKWWAITVLGVCFVLFVASLSRVLRLEASRRTTKSSTTGEVMAIRSPPIARHSFRASAQGNSGCRTDKQDPPVACTTDGYRVDRHRPKPTWQVDARIDNFECGPQCLRVVLNVFPQKHWEFKYVQELARSSIIRDRPRQIKHCCSYKAALVFLRSGQSTESFQSEVHGGCYGNRSVLFDASDEFCSGRSLGLYRDFNVVLRQYACWDRFGREFENNGNVHIIPLGFKSGLVNGVSSSSKASQVLAKIENSFDSRNFTWSLIGTVKSDRRTAIRTFTRLSSAEGFTWITGKKTPGETAQILESSQFVVSPRGNANLDCFRHYEASIHGAIPIVAGTQHELNNTFGHFHQLPPWIFAPSWRAGFAEMKALVAAGPAAVAQRQKAVIEWYRAEIRVAQSLVQGGNFSLEGTDECWSGAPVETRGK